MTPQELQNKIKELENDMIELEDRHAERMSELLDMMTEMAKNINYVMQVVSRHQELWNGSVTPNRLN